MRYGLLISALALGGCSSGLLEELTSAPSGLPVSVTSSFLAGIVPASGSIFGKGDSVVAIVSQPATCGKTLTAEAGTTAARLVVTIILTSDAVQSCSPLNGMTTYRAVVRNVPAGAYDASGHMRFAGLGGNSDTTFARATIVLP